VNVVHHFSRGQRSSQERGPYPELVGNGGQLLGGQRVEEMQKVGQGQGQGWKLQQRQGTDHNGLFLVQDAFITITQLVTSSSCELIIINDNLC
jgi:hypothetical protein